MIHITYNDNNYQTLYPKFAKAFSSEFVNNRVVLHPSAGKGYFELVSLGDDLNGSILNFKSAVDIKFCRKKRNEPFYILHFDELHSREPMSIQIDGAVDFAQGRLLSTVMLTCNLFDFCYVLPVSTSVRSIYILLTQEWMKKYMELEENDEVLKTYLSLRSQSLNNEPFTSEYRKYFNQVFDTPEKKPLRELHLRNSIMMLVELFFSRLYIKQKKVADSPIRKMATSDLYKLMEIESLLVKDYSKTPPTINELAKTSNMSVSKLKTSFKRVYGTGIYEYYQKNRMHRALQLLSNEGYTVKEVGMKLGYTNLSNFSLAFKKEFGILPSSI